MKHYLGDGVYVTFGPWEIELETEREENGRNVIVLEPQMLHELMTEYNKFVERQNLREETL